MFDSKVPVELLEKLKAPLPKEAINQHPTKKYLSTIKAIYVVERLNDVFGLGNWSIHNEFVERVDKMVVIKAILEVPMYSIKIESYGGNNNEDLGDAYKGACTDALTKIGSYLYVAMDVFKGLAEKPSMSHNKSPKTDIDYSKPEMAGKKSSWVGPATDAQKNAILSICKRYNSPAPDVENMTKSQAGHWMSEAKKRIDGGDTDHE